MKKQLLCSTALAGLALFVASPAFAACDNNAPITGDPAITCADPGPDNTGIAGAGADGITVNVSGTVDTAGAAIELGDSAVVNVVGGSVESANNTGIIVGGGADITVDGVVTGGTNAITIGDGSVLITSGGNVNGNIDGIEFTNGTGSVVDVHGTLTGGTNAVSFGGGDDVFIYHTGATVTGIVDGAGGNDQFRYSADSTSSFNTDLLGTQFTNFDSAHKDGAATLTLTGTTVRDWGVTSGTLVGGTANVGAIDLGGGTTFRFNSGGTHTNDITGSGNVQKIGGAALALTGNNSFTGELLVDSATLEVDAASAFSGVSQVSLNAATFLLGSAITTDRAFDIGAGDAAIDNLGFATTLGGNISGPGILTIDGLGATAISGANTVAGFIFNGAAITGNSASLVGNLTLNGSAVTFNQAGTGTQTGDIDGTGSLVKIGAGNLILTGTNTYIGGTTVSAGTLTGDADSLQGLITNDSILTFDQTGTGTFNGTISGTGRVDKEGAGTLVINTAQGYSGDTNINAGILAVNGSDRLGDGSVTNNIVFGGGTLRYDAAFDLTRGISLINGGGTFNTNGFNSTLSGVIDGNDALFKTGNGRLTLTNAANSYLGDTHINGGQLMATSAGALGNAGNAIVFNGGAFEYGASFDHARDITIDAGGGAIDMGGFNSTLNGEISGAGDLYLSGGGVLTLTHDNTGFSGDVTIDASTLSINAANQLGSGGLLTFDNGTLVGGGAFDLAQDLAFTGDGTIDSVFNHTFSGAVTGSGDIIKDGSGILGLTGDLTGYTGNAAVNAGILSVSNDFTGDADIASGAVFEISDNTGGAYAGQLTGAGAFAKTGTGDLELTADNSGFSGTVSVTDSTLAVNNSNNLGDGSVTNTIALENATLDYQNSVFNNTRDVAISGASVTINNDNAITMSGDITGNADLVKTGSARLILTGTNTYIGNLLINEGAVRISANTGFGDLGNDIRIGEAVLEYDASFDHARNITLDDVNSRIDTRGFNSTLSGDIDGAGRFVKQGAGTITLTGANTYLGGVLVEDGTLVGDTGSIIGNIENNASVVYDQAAGDTVAGTLSGTGDFTFDGGAEYELTGTNTYTGGTTVTAGTTITGNTAAIQGDIENDGDVVIVQTADGTYAGDMSGTGALTVDIDPTFALTLTGTNTYSGGTSILNGYLIGDTDSLQGDIDIALNGILAFEQPLAGSYGGNLSGTGQLLKLGPRTLTLTGTSTLTGTISVIDGTLVGNTSNLIGNISNGGALVFDQALDGIYAGAISGPGDVYKDGIGELTLTGTNIWGDLYILDGVVIGTTASIHSNPAGTVYNDASLVFDQAATSVFASSITGTGSTTFDGGGVYTLRGDNDYSGGTIITAATTVRGNTTAVQGDIANAGNVIFDLPGTGIYAGEMSGAGGLEKTGAGQVSLTTDSTGFTGDTLISEGRLHFNADWRNTNVTVADGGLLGGNGFIGNTIVDSGGIFAPGNSIDTINVIGDLTFNAGSILQIEFTATPNDSDKIIATGDVYINGGSVLAIASGGSYAPNTLYTIIEGNSINGTFLDIDTDMAFLDAQLDYFGTYVQMGITRNDTDFAAVAEDEIQVGVADAITSLGTGNDLFDAFTSLSFTDARSALDIMTGEHVAGNLTTMANRADAMRSTISSHLVGLTHANNENMLVSALAPVNDPGTYIAAMLEPAAGDLPNWDNKRVWMQMLGGFGEAQARRTTPEQDYYSFGAVAGLDIPMEKGGWYGFFGGYETGEVETASQLASSDIDSYHVGAYATIPLDEGFNISGGIQAAYHDVSSQRYVVFPGFESAPRGETHGTTVAAYAEISKPYKVLDAAVEPYAALSVTHSRMEGFREEGGGTAGLDVSSSSVTNPATTIGVRMARMVYMQGLALKLNASIGWQHVFGDTDSTSTMRFVAGGTTFESIGTPQERDSILFGIGLDGKLTDRANTYVDYAGRYGNESVDHKVTAGVKIKF